MRQGDDELIRALGDANPVPIERLSGWEKGEEGQQVLARITTTRGRRPSTAGAMLSAHRVAWLRGLTAAAIAMALIWLLPTILHPNDSAPGSMTGATSIPQQGSQASPRPTAPSQPAILSSLVSKIDALTGIVRLASDLHLGNSLAVAGVGPSGQLEKDAQTLGVPFPIGASEDSLQETTTRGEYVVWLWGAFAKELQPRQSVDFRNSEGLSSDQLRAVKGLVAAEILQLDAHGVFEANAQLTAKDEQYWLDRIRQAITSNTGLTTRKPTTSSSN